MDSLLDEVVENANEGTDTVYYHGSDRTELSTSNFTNIENISGFYSSSIINLTGDDGNNDIEGNANDNVIDGGVGEDFMAGEQAMILITSTL